MESRAVPLRIEILPSHWSRNRLIERESLTAPGIAEATHALDQRGLQRRAVAPAIAEALGVGALERAAETDAGIAHRDDHDPAAESAAEGVGLHRHPAAGAGVLHNILAGLRKRHTEAQRRFHLQTRARRGGCVDAPSEILSTTACTSSDARTGVTSSSTSDGPVAVALGHLAVQLEQLRRIVEEPGPRPVPLDLVAGGNREAAASPAWPRPAPAPRSAC